MLALALAATSCGLDLTAPASAQGNPTQLPGLIVTTPQPSAPVTVTTPPPSAPVTVTTPPAARALPPATGQGAAQAKPRPKTAAAAGPRRPIGAETSIPADGPAIGRAAFFVNDQPITGYQLEGRSRLLLLGANSVGQRASDAMKRLVQSEETSQRWRKIIEETIRQNPGKSQPEIVAILERRKGEMAESLRNQAIASARASVMPELRKQARDDLIEEQLKLQEAKRLNITIEDRDIDPIMRGLAERNKMTDQQFGAHLKSMGADATAMRERFRATLAWNEVVRRTFGNEVSVNERDVEKFVSQGAKGEDQIELKLVRLLLPLPPKADQRSLAERYDAAERTRQTKPGCKGLIGEATKLSAKFEDLGGRTPGQFSDPIRTWLLSAEENEVLPPNVTAAGIELLAVCKRVVVKADEQKRNAVISDLRQSAFEVRARGLLQDLKARAEIVDSNRQALR